MIAIERLIMLALDELEEADAEAVEAHILACGGCAATFERLLRLTSALRELVGVGGMAFPVTSTLSEELQAAGLISRSYRLVPEHPVPCTVTADDIYALTTLEVELGDAERVDLSVSLPTGNVRMNDVPFDREHGLVAYVMPSRRLRLLPTGRVSIEIHAMGSGGERRLGPYVLEHTAFAGG